MKKIYLVTVLFLSLLLIGCGSRYTLKTGGWKLEDKKELGTCLTVFGDGDPEVVVAASRRHSLSRYPWRSYVRHALHLSQRRLQMALSDAPSSH